MAELFRGNEISPKILMAINFQRGDSQSSEHSYFKIRSCIVRSDLKNMIKTRVLVSLGSKSPHKCFFELIG